MKGVGSMYKGDYLLDPKIYSSNTVKIRVAYIFPLRRNKEEREDVVT